MESIELPGWLQEKKDAARRHYENTQTPKLAYGLTIRLSTRGLALEGREDSHSEQVITIEHDGCDVDNLFNRLDDEDVQKHLLTAQPADKTRFDSFQEAFFDIGLLIIAPPNSTATVDLTRTLTSETFTEHILIIAKENSDVTVIDKYQSDGTTLRAGTVEIVTEDGARARYAAIQALGEDCTDLASYRAKAIGDDSKPQWFVASLGSKLTHANVDTHLEGKGSESKSYGVFLGTQKQQFDLSASTFHTGDHSISDMYTRGVLGDASKAVYRGNIDIAAQAYGCNGYQTEETVLLSDKAVADAIPNLEIRNNDVQCSHGATIGRIDDEQLFYLTSRGLDEQEAVRMIIEGFFEPVAAKLDWPQLYALIKPLVHEKIT